MENRVFFPQECLDQWGMEGKIELTPTELTVLAEARTYAIVEVVYVKAEVSGAPDAHGLVGKVRAKSELEALGAELLEGSMLLGDNAYDVTAGWAGAPTTPFEEHLLSPARMTARAGRLDIGAGPQSDEELLERFRDGTL